MAKAVASALRDGGYANGVIVARNEAAGRALAQSLGYQWQAQLGDLRPQMLINVTPIGMTGGAEADQLAFEADAVDQAQTVFDVVAIPAETPLIVRARAQGKRVITGLEVIAIQALEQFVLYTGGSPATRSSSKAPSRLREAEQRGQSPVGAGKPGSYRGLSVSGLFQLCQPFFERGNPRFQLFDALRLRPRRPRVPTGLPRAAIIASISAGSPSAWV